MKNKFLVLSVLLATTAGAEVLAAPKVDTASRGATVPQEIVIKGEDRGAKIGSRKPPLDLKADPFETVRASLQPDQSLLVAQSPATAGWKYIHPALLFSSRVIEPWRSIFSERSGIIFNLRQQLQEVLQKPVSKKDAKHFQWSLTIADEEGRVFQEYEGASKPPEELFWNGQNSRRQWVQPGRSYSPVYKFVDSGGSPYTRVGRPIQFTGIAHQEAGGLVIGLDSATLFGPLKAAVKMDAAGESLLRDACDFVKRRYNGASVAIRNSAGTKELAESQAELVRTYLARELMLVPQAISVQTDTGPFPEQHVEILLLSR